MARPIVWSDPAVEDLEAAVEFIAKDSEAYARTLAQLAVDAAESLGDVPNRGHRLRDPQLSRFARRERARAFLDEQALVLDDPDHSDTEDRFILLGMTAALHVLSVCHCVRESGSRIRLISARRATKAEQKQYWERLTK